MIKEDPSLSAHPDSLQPAPLDSLKEAEAVFYARDYYRAEPMLRRALARADAAYGSSSTQAAHVIDLLVQASLQMGKSTDPEILELAERAYRSKLAILGSESVSTATSLSSLGVIRAMRGDLAAADSIFTEVLRVRETLGSPRHPNVAVILGHLANVRHMRSDYRGALPLLRRALSILEENDTPDGLMGVVTRANLAIMLIKLGEYAEARSLLDRQIALLQSHGLSNESLGWAYQLLGSVHRSVGDYEEALRCMRQSLEIREAVHTPGHPRIAEVHLQIGYVLWLLDRNAEARKEVERGRAMWAENHGPDHTYLTTFDQVLGQLALAEGRLDEARGFFTQTLESRRRVMGEEAPKVAEALASLAAIDTRQGLYDDACTRYAQALDILSSGIGQEHPRVAETAGSLAEVLFLSGHPQEAAERALQAERIFTRQLRATLRSLPERQALQYARQRGTALDLALSISDDLASPELTARTWDALIRSRALVLDEMAARNRPEGRVDDPAFAELWEAYQHCSTTLANLYVRGPEDLDAEIYRRLLEDARRDLEEAEHRLSAADDGYRRTTEKEGVGWVEVRRALPRATAVVAYALYRHYPRDPVPSLETELRYRAFVLSAAGGDPVSFDLGSAGEIDARIAAWKTEASLGALRAGRSREECARAYREAAANVRSAVWDPVAAYLGGATRVLLVPDGQIHLLAFGSLPSEDGSYLLETGLTFHNLASEREVASTPKEAEPAGGALVLGAPDFESADPGDPRKWTGDDTDAPPSTQIVFRGQRPDCDGLRSMHFDPLPRALEEAREVARLWESGPRAAASTPGKASASPVRLLTGREATEEAFKRVAPGSRILHLTTHGYYVDGRCPSGLQGTRGIGLLVAEPGQGEPVGALSDRETRNPLLLSGLALAGANRREQAGPDEEDGILTAQEIAALDLSSVRWAVLSACETGTGEVLNGEGVFGLQRAFRIAGARTLVTSLWSVKDEAARDWMAAFYRAAAQRGLPAMDAVREASISVLKERRRRGEDPHPFYWAAFVSSGDWR